MTNCNYSVTPVTIGLGFGFWTALGLGLGLRGPDVGLGLDNFHMGIAEKMRTYITTFSQASDSEFKYFITPLFKFCPCDFVSLSLEK